MTETAEPQWRDETPAPEKPREVFVLEFSSRCKCVVREEEHGSWSFEIHEYTGIRCWIIDRVRGFTANKADAITCATACAKGLFV